MQHTTNADTDLSDARCAKEIDAQLKGLLNDRPAVFFVQHPCVDPALGIAKAHTAQADP